MNLTIWSSPGFGNQCMCLSSPRFENFYLSVVLLTIPTLKTTNRSQSETCMPYMFAWNVFKSLIAKNCLNLSRSFLLTHNTKATLTSIWVSKILEIELYGAYVRQTVGRFIIQTKIWFEVIYVFCFFELFKNFIK